MKASPFTSDPYLPTYLTQSITSSTQASPQKCSAITIPYHRSFQHGPSPIQRRCKLIPLFMSPSCVFISSSLCLISSYFHLVFTSSHYHVISFSHCFISSCLRPIILSSHPPMSSSLRVFISSHHPLSASHYLSISSSFHSLVLHSMIPSSLALKVSGHQSFSTSYPANL